MFGAARSTTPPVVSLPSLAFFTSSGEGVRLAAGLGVSVGEGVGEFVGTGVISGVLLGSMLCVGSGDRPGDVLTEGSGEMLAAGASGGVGVGAGEEPEPMPRMMR